jgi:hypothetical protein
MTWAESSRVKDSALSTLRQWTCKVQLVVQLVDLQPVMGIGGERRRPCNCNSLETDAQDAQTESIWLKPGSSKVSVEKVDPSQNLGVVGPER